MAYGWANVREKWDTIMEQLDQKLHQKSALSDQLEKLEKRLGIPRLKMVQVLLLLAFILISMSLGTELISNCVGFLYPAYASIKAIETARKDDDTRWLTYWVVYGFFIFTESITDIFLSWFPFYWVSKCIFLVWCMLPTPSNGSDFIYNFIIRPFFLKHERKIDSAINDASSAAKQYIGKVSNVLESSELMPKQMAPVYQEKENSNGYFDSPDSGRGSDYRDKSPSFTFKLDELRNKYGDGKTLMSPERSLSSTRSRLFADRSPERSSSPGYMPQSSVDERPPQPQPRERTFSEAARERGYLDKGEKDKDFYDRSEPFASVSPSSISPVRSTARQTSRSGQRSSFHAGESYPRAGKY